MNCFCHKNYFNNNADIVENLPSLALIVLAASSMLLKFSLIFLFNSSISAHTQTSTESSLNVLAKAISLSKSSNLMTYTP
jgi:hypothetical protein